MKIPQKNSDYVAMCPTCNLYYTQGYIDEIKALRAAVPFTDGEFVSRVKNTSVGQMIHRSETAVGGMTGRSADTCCLISILNDRMKRVRVRDR